MVLPEETQPLHALIVRTYNPKC